MTWLDTAGRLLWGHPRPSLLDRCCAGAWHVFMWAVTPGYRAEGWARLRARGADAVMLLVAVGLLLVIVAESVAWRARGRLRRWRRRGA